MHSVMQNHCKFIFRENVLNMEYKIKETCAILRTKQVKAMRIHLNKLESPLPMDYLCQVWLTLAQWFWRRFLNIVQYFFYFVIISPWKRVWPIIWTNLNPLHPRWSTTVIPLFSYYIPFEGDITLHLYKIQVCLEWLILKCKN